ncbi:MAG: ABC transporter substrate-binding protein [Planctomycetota bacterium]|jgi:ABC-type Fe3+ transport system substrate-binding protein
MSRTTSARRTRRQILLFGAIVLFALAFAVAGGLMSCSPGEGEAVVVLSPHWEGIMREFGRGFSEWHLETYRTPAHVEQLDVGGGGSKIKKYIQNRFETDPETIDVDVLFGGGVPTYARLAEMGFLVEPELPAYVEAALEREIAGLPLHDPERRWFGAAMSGFGIVRNRRIVERMSLPGVREWADLTNPRLFGWVASGNPSSSGSVHTLFELVLQAYGFEEGYAAICQLAGNVAAFDQGGNAAPRAVGMGQSAYGMCIDMYGREQQSRLGEENVDFMMPESLTVISADPIAVLKGAPHPELAARFLEYVLSEPGQKLWYLRVGAEGGPKRYALNRLPVVRRVYAPGAETDVTVDPFSWRGKLDFDEGLASRRYGVLDGLLQATVIDVHGELREAWRATVEAGETEHPELVAEFCRSPVTAEEMLELAKTWTADVVLRQEREDEWSRFARGKFASVRAKALAAVAERR